MYPNAAANTGVAQGCGISTTTMRLGALYTGVTLKQVVEVVNQEPTETLAEADAKIASIGGVKAAEIIADGGDCDAHLVDGEAERVTVGQGEDVCITGPVKITNVDGTVRTQVQEVCVAAVPEAKFASGSVAGKPSQNPDGTVVLKTANSDRSLVDCGGALQWEILGMTSAADQCGFVPTLIPLPSPTPVKPDLNTPLGSGKACLRGVVMVNDETAGRMTLQDFNACDISSPLITWPAQSTGINWVPNGPIHMPYGSGSVITWKNPQNGYTAQPIGCDIDPVEVRDVSGGVRSIDTREPQFDGTPMKGHTLVLTTVGMDSSKPQAVCDWYRQAFSGDPKNQPCETLTGFMAEPLCQVKQGTEISWS